jgi:hypothetical protein
MNYQIKEYAKHWIVNTENENKRKFLKVLNLLIPDKKEIDDFNNIAEIKDAILNLIDKVKLNKEEYRDFLDIISVAYSLAVTNPGYGVFENYRNN